MADYRREFLESGDTMDGCSNLRRFENMQEWYDWVQKLSRKETCPENWVPDIQLVCIRNSDKRIVGMLDIRHELNEALLNYFGNIGYSIRPTERQKGYAILQLQLAKEICRSMGMKRILISCHKNNSASAKVIMRNGGDFENEVIDHRNGAIFQRYWIEL